MLPTNKRQQGKKYEQIVKNYLLKKSYQIVKENYYLGHNEIDLIAINPLPNDQLAEKILVFIEVKYRILKSHYNYLATITPSKKRNIIKVAHQFMNTHPDFQTYYSRYDAVFVVENPPQKPEIIHFENAFMETH